MDADLALALRLPVFDLDANTNTNTNNSNNKKNTIAGFAGLQDNGNVKGLVVIPSILQILQSSFLLLLLLLLLLLSFVLLLLLLPLLSVVVLGSGCAGYDFGTRARSHSQARSLGSGFDEQKYRVAVAPHSG